MSMTQGDFAALSDKLAMADQLAMHFQKRALDAETHNEKLEDIFRSIGVPMTSRAFMERLGTAEALLDEIETAVDNRAYATTTSVVVKVARILSKRVKP